MSGGVRLASAVSRLNLPGKATSSRRLGAWRAGSVHPRPGASIDMGMFDRVFTYETVQVLKVRSKTLSVVHRSMQLFTVVYVVLYIYWFKHGYQLEEKGIGSVSVKVKGVGHTAFDDAEAANKRGLASMRVQDAVDIVYPPKEEGALFLTTNYADVPRQSRGTCPSQSVDDACTADADCPRGTASKSQFGIRTGKCSEKKTCTVLGWCPTETNNGSTPTKDMLAEVEHFTIFARVAIDFPFADVRTNNLHGASEDVPTDLTPGVNLFEVADVLAATNTSFAEVAANGAVLMIAFNWDCNLDQGIGECSPEVEMRRLDDYANPLSRGYNYRYATYYAEGGVEYRYLRKAYGLRILVQSSGRCRKFDWGMIFVTLGSAVALLSVATVVVDGLAVYVLPKRDVYQRIKYNSLDEREEEERLQAEREERQQQEAAAGLVPAPKSTYGATDVASGVASSDRKGWFG